MTVKRLRSTSWPVGKASATADQRTTAFNSSRTLRRCLLVRLHALGVYSSEN